MSATMIRKAASTRVASARVQAVRPVTVRGRRVITCAVVEKAEVVESVRMIISTQLGMELDKVAPESKFVDLGADSLDTVEIMMALEEKFEVPMDEESAEKISTVQEAADMIHGIISKKQ